MFSLRLKVMEGIQHNRPQRDKLRLNLYAEGAGWKEPICRLNQLLQPVMTNTCLCAWAADSLLMCRSTQFCSWSGRNWNFFYVLKETAAGEIESEAETKWRNEEWATEKQLFTQFPVLSDEEEWQLIIHLLLRVSLTFVVCGCKFTEVLFFLKYYI